MNNILYEITKKIERTKRIIAALQEDLARPFYSDLVNRQYEIWLEELIKIYNEHHKKLQCELKTAQKAKKSL
jgi:predicted acetyltransferase